MRKQPNREANHAHEKLHHIPVAPKLESISPAILSIREHTIEGIREGKFDIHKDPKIPIETFRADLIQAIRRGAFDNAIELGLNGNNK